ncbi:MAG: methionyl-tRNA formyltransferase [candidate division WOR-3 bacterium]
MFEGKLIFFGTGEFAAKVFVSMLKNGLKPEVIVTSPDKPQGRGLKVTPTPVKELAIQHGIKKERIFQPYDVNHPALLSELKKFEPEVIFLTDFGQILGKELLSLPKNGAINLHPSLLPKYRGAAPLERAMMDGEKETGFTFFIMDEGIDTGKIIYQEKIEILEKTRGEIESIIAEKAMSIFPEIYSKYKKGEIKPKPQKGESSYAKKIDEDELWIDWKKDAFLVMRHIHALSPNPGARTHFDGKYIKIYRVREVPDYNGPIGKIIVDSSRLFVLCGKGAVEVLELQPSGKKKMSASEFVQGYHPFWAE